MSDATATKKLIGFDVNAVLTIGDPSSRRTIDVSNSVTEVNWFFQNFEFVPRVWLKFLVEAQYITSMTNPYELELEITEKGMGSTPRTRLTGKFFCMPESAPMSIVHDSSYDLVKFQKDDYYYPIDVSKTLAKETSIVASKCKIEDVITKTFNASATGSCKLQLGTLSNKNTYKQVVLPWGKFEDHITDLIENYGISDLELVAYSDFSDIYIHSANETVTGDNKPLIIFFGELPTDKEDSLTIPNECYMVRTPPKIDSVAGFIQGKYSENITSVMYPRSGGYSISTMNMEDIAKKMKTTRKTDVFNYFGLYKPSDTEVFYTADETFPLETKLMKAATGSYYITFTVFEPFTLDDFIIGRPVQFVSSMSEYVGLNMSGYVSAAEYILRNPNQNRWSGCINVTVKCASNSSVVK